MAQIKFGSQNLALFTGKFSGVDMSGYGLDIIGVVSLQGIDLLNKQLDYKHALLLGKDYIATIQRIINNINEQQQRASESGRLALSAGDVSYLKKYDLPDYNYKAEDGYKVLLSNFNKLKKSVGIAFDEVKKEFMKEWQSLHLNALKSSDLSKLGISMIEDVLEIVNYRLNAYEYTVNGTSKVLLDPVQKNEYVKGYLKLADAYLKTGKKTEARKALEDGLKINNELYSQKKISIDFKNEFERRLNTLGVGKTSLITIEATSQGLITAIIELNSSLRILSLSLQDTI